MLKLTTAVTLSIAALAAAPLVGAAGGRQSPDDKVVPVHQEPRHRLVFDSPGTRILDIQIPPGDTTLFHTHNDPIVYITMSTSQTRSQTLGRDWTAPPAAGSGAAAAPSPPVRIGRMTSTTSYVEEPLTHRVNNVGQTLFRLIGITNASAGDDRAAPSPDFPAKPELENRWFRGYRLTLGAGAAGEHRHANPVAIVLISGRARAATTALETPGAFAWFDAQAPHALEAVGGSAELVEVEVRRPR